jgi:hypothetical protein
MALTIQVAVYIIIKNKIELNHGIFCMGVYCTLSYILYNRFLSKVSPLYKKKGIGYYKNTT